MSKSNANMYKGHLRIHEPCFNETLLSFFIENKTHSLQNLLKFTTIKFQKWVEGPYEVPKKSIVFCQKKHEYFLFC